MMQGDTTGERVGASGGRGAPWLRLVALVALAAGLRLIQLAALPASFFEQAALDVVAQDIGTAWRVASLAGAPLAGALFWLNAQWFELPLLGPRLMVVIMSALLLPLLWLASAHTLGWGAATLALLLLTTAPAAVAAAQQATPGALALAVLPLAFIAYAQLAQRGSVRAWALFGVAGVLLTQCWFPSAALVLAQLLALLLGVRRERRVEVLIGGLLCTLLLGLILVPTLNSWQRPDLLLNGTASLGQIGREIELLLLGDMLPGMLRLLAFGGIAAAVGCALIDTRRYSGLLPHLLMIVAVVALAGFGLPDGAGALALLALPSLLVVIASGLSSLAGLRFCWPLAAVFTAVLLTVHFMRLVGYYLDFV
ncbi:MAG: glycosyltransferase family 39 protein [Roseiflexaceae bacterium]|nr:glycosyltransferase family 39 protein [Roseiflexaceae bacterium]